MTENDAINQLAVIADDSAAAALRRQKPDLVAFAQGSYDALLEPAHPGGVSLLERHAIAYRVGLLTGFDTVANRHRGRLQALGASEDLLAALADLSGTVGLEPRLAALIVHTDRVTLTPGASKAAHIDALRDAGLTSTEIVTVAQLIGFLAYQVRAIAVARAFAFALGDVA